MTNSIQKKLLGLKKTINIVIVGMGAMGKGLLYQSTITPGINCIGISEVKIEKAISFAKDIGLNYKIVKNLNELNDSIKQGFFTICEDGNLLADIESADVFIESSDAIKPAAEYSIRAIKNKKHLVLMNAEIDLIFGPHLLDLANKNNVVYTSCDGDQHSVLKRLTDDIRLWGIELVMAGNIKGYLDRYANPKSIIPEADKRSLSYDMCSAMTDGTKMNIEMALIANGTGLTTKKSGMHGPKAKHVNDVFKLFDFEKLWNDKQAFVDYVVGAEPGGGVFAIGHCENKYQREMLKYYKMGDGPFYLFYRPYHLCHVEAMETIADAYLNRTSLLKPDFGLKTNVYSFAKKDIKKGEKLDGIGKFTCYGLIENSEKNNGLPICIADNLRLNKYIKKDSKINFDDVEYDPKSFEIDLFLKSKDKYYTQ